MGLFTNKKKLCPICGSPTPRLLPTKIEGEPICSVCADKINLPQGRANNLTRAEFQKYLEFYDGENAKLREMFQETYSRSSRFFSNTFFICDSVHQLFKITNLNNAIVFPGNCVERMTISEDDRVLMELTPQSLRFYTSPVPDEVNALQMEIDAFNREYERYEFLEEQRKRMEEQRKRVEELRAGSNEKQDYSSSSYSSPSFRPVLPFEKFHIELVLNHPWWDSVKEHEGAPTFDRTHPSVYDYMADYNQKVSELTELIQVFRDTCYPNCKVIYENDNHSLAQEAAPAQPVSTADELKKFKELLDMGAITQEEFDAKKKQLLGL